MEREGRRGEQDLRAFPQFQISHHTTDYFHYCNASAFDACLLNDYLYEILDDTLLPTKKNIIL